jgi:catechol 2,3-dioxygenase-like lactoylglutathione lyase family enzyme
MSPERESAALAAAGDESRDAPAAACREGHAMTAARGIGLKRLQHLVLWVSDVERSVRFYRDLLGFEVRRRYSNAAFLAIPGSADDHHLGLFQQAGVQAPDERAARLYHAAWEVGEITDLVRARDRLAAAGALVGSSDHGTSLSLYAEDPDGLEFEIFWTVPGGISIGTRPLDLEGELARRGIPSLP